MKIGRNMKTKKSRAYWAFLKKCALIVDSWPEWKRQPLQETYDE